MKKTSVRILIIALSVLLVLAIGIGVVAIIYVNDYSHAEETAVAAMANGTTHGSYTVFDGGGEVGFIFYPGGKVEAAAYAPLLSRLSQNGITSVLCEMPFRLAVFGVNAWQDAKSLAPAVTTWYIGGHSLGGAMAASCATAENGFAGLILLAAYPTSEVSLPVLSIYGSRDTVMDAASYAAGVPLMPSLIEVVIDGGNHAQFGHYGTQEGDTPAAVDRDEQITETASAITSFLFPA